MSGMQKTWYYKEGSKAAELWTLLHIPYTLILLSFVVIGFGVQKPINYGALILICTAYFIGIQASHFFDQLPGMGSSYVKHLTSKELLAMGSVCLIISSGIAIWFIITYNAWHFIWLVFIQSSFVVLYPVATLFKGFFHNDFWFGLSFGFLPVVIGYYANTLTLSWVIIPFGLVCFLISLIEITLSRYVRKQRIKMIEEYIAKPEKALKLLCLLSYALAVSVFIWF